MAEEDTAEEDMVFKNNDLVSARGALLLLLLDDKQLVVDSRQVNNLITTAGSIWLAGKCSGTPTPLSHIAVGTGSTAPTVGDTGLAAQLEKIGLTLAPRQGTGSAANSFAVRAVFDTTEAVGTLAEAGLFHGTTTLFSRVLVSPALVKPNDKVLVAQWTISF